jgi:hypothetical protein
MEKKGAKLPESFPVTTIAHVTEGYTGGNVPFSLFSSKRQSTK